MDSLGVPRYVLNKGTRCRGVSPRKIDEQTKKVHRLVYRSGNRCRILNPSYIVPNGSLHRQYRLLPELKTGDPPLSPGRNRDRVTSTLPYRRRSVSREGPESSRFSSDLVRVRKSLEDT